MAPHLKGLPAESGAGGARVIRLPSFRRQAFSADLISMGGYLAVGMIAGLWLILRSRPDLIHVHFAVPAGALAWLLSKITRVPYVLTTHLGDVPGGVPEKTDAWFRWIQPLTPRIWRDAARVTAISDYTRRLALRHYPVGIQVIPNGINLEHFAASGAALGDPPRIIFAGRLVKQKNPVQLVEILSGLTELPWTCTLAGDGPLLDEVRAAIARNGLVDRVSLRGWIQTDEVIAMLRESDILFLPSLSEGIPMVGLQSLGIGLAIVASRVGGMAELVAEGENGFLHAPEDVAGFRASLRRLLTDDELTARMRRRSRELAAKFDLSAIADAYESVFRSVLARE